MRWIEAHPGQGAMSHFLHPNTLLRSTFLVGCAALLACTAPEGASESTQQTSPPPQASLSPVSAPEARERLFAFIGDLRTPADLAPSNLEQAFDMPLAPRDGSRALRGERPLGQGQWVVSVRPDDQAHEVIVYYPAPAGTGGCALSIGQLASTLRTHGFEVLLSDAIDRPKIWSFPGRTPTGHRLSILAMTTPEAASETDTAPCVHRVDISMEANDEQATQ